MISIHFTGRREIKERGIGKNEGWERKNWAGEISSKDAANCWETSIRGAQIYAIIHKMCAIWSKCHYVLNIMKSL